MFDYAINIVSKQSIANYYGFAFVIYLQTLSSVANYHLFGVFYYFLHNGIYIADVSKLLWTGFFKGKRHRPGKDLSTEDLSTEEEEEQVPS